MNNFPFYLGAFLLALAILIVAHEYGHFLVARLCGVKVLRFSLGFGRPLFLRRFGKDQTEWVIAAFPLGGYVKMLDEREEPVATAELPRAFNRQPVVRRMAIAAAGPVANFLLAIFFYWALFIHGVEELRPILGAPEAGSIAARAGFTDGERVTRIDGKTVATWQALRWEILQHALEKRVISLEVINLRDEIATRWLDLSTTSTDEPEKDLLQQIGLRLYRPQGPAVIGKVTPGGVADAAGLRAGDRITQADGKTVESWSDLVTVIRDSADRKILLEGERESELFSVQVEPTAAEEGGKRIGRIGIAMREEAGTRALMMTEARYGPLSALSKATLQTWDTSVFSLKMIGRMLTGNLSLKNISGPVTIADYAGQSARLGLTYYVQFLALISISLGVLNLLPIPMLDGGHLMYYTIEIIKGSPLSEKAMETGQRLGLALLLMLMAFAFYNDINRLFSG